MTEIVSLNFDKLPIRIQEIDGEVWFVAKDVCDILGIKNSRQALSRLDEDEKGVTTNDTLGGRQEMSIINTRGMTGLIMKSRLPAAKKFNEWVMYDVMPSVLITGSYGKLTAENYSTASLEDKLKVVDDMRKLTGADRMEAELRRVHKANLKILADLKDIAEERGISYEDVE